MPPGIRRRDFVAEKPDILSTEEVFSHAENRTGEKNRLPGKCRNSETGCVKAYPKFQKQKKKSPEKKLAWFFFWV
jgi:hypothetical protein